MGKKKEVKEPEATARGEGVSASLGVFSTAALGVPDDSSFFHLFSDANPFKRKHHEVERGFGGHVNSIESPSNGDSAKVEVKKRKVIEGNLDGEATTPSESSKSKKDKRKHSNSTGSGLKKESRKLKQRAVDDVGSISNALLEAEEAVASGSGIESNEKGSKTKEDHGKSNEKEKRDKKKRKRDELERAYESKKYGASEEDAANEKGGAEQKVVGKKRKKIDNPEELLVSKEGFDDENKLLRTVFVGNLPFKLKKKSLFKEFSKFGEVESVRIRSVPISDTKVPRKGAVMTKKFNDNADSIHAYIVFKSEEAAKASLAHNMAVVGGNHIRVDRACPPRKKLKGENAPIYDNKRTVFVGNLPFDVKDEEIYQLFSRINNLESTIEAVRVIRDPNTSMGKGIAYVLFKTREAANQIIKKRNLKLKDRELRVSHARANSSSTPSKRSNPSPANPTDTPAAKKPAMDSSTTPNKGQKPSKASLSYQGLHGRKASSQKKPWKKESGLVSTGKVSSAKRAISVKERSSKRPSVAARKAKALAMKEVGASSGMGKKRKLESRTPESFRQKKVKKFRQ